MVAACGREPSFGSFHECAQGCRADQPLDLLQPVERRVCLGELPASDSGLDEHLEDGSVLQFSVCRHFAELPLEELGCAKRLASVEREAGAAQLLRLGGAGSVEE